MSRRIKNNLTATSWREFDALHGSYIKKSSTYEYLFLTEVIFKIPEIHPEDLVAQYKFFDDNGKMRFVDYVILIGGHPAIAIEVDGYDKTGSGTGMNMEEWSNFMYRQNQIVMKGMTLLRFANRDFSNDPRRAISLIKKAMQQQREKFSDSALPRSIGSIAAMASSAMSNFFKAASISYQGNRRLNKDRDEALIADLRKKYGLDK